MAKEGKKRRRESDDEPRLLKWVGGITAVLTLVFALQQAIQLISDNRERQREIAELTTVASQQRNAKDYRAAWATYERALEVAEPTGQLARLTGQLGDQRRRLREAQEDLAMEWLENLQVKSEGGSFSEVIAPLDPVLNRGVAASTGQRQADLLAHAGWATFLKWRDGQARMDPEPQYTQALASDRSNPYANAYRAHWLLWTRHEAALSEARASFSAALASGRVREHVRSIQLSALKNLGTEGEPSFVSVVNEMRMKGENIPPRARSDLAQMYSFVCGLGYDRERLAAYTASVPIADQLATFQALFFGADGPGPDTNPRPGADACLAVLLEAAGKPEEALPVWTALAEKFPPKSGVRLGDRARDAVNRLQQGSKPRSRS